jgi:hypothetical protein
MRNAVIMQAIKSPFVRGIVLLLPLAMIFAGTAAWIGQGLRG